VLLSVKPTIDLLCPAPLLGLKHRLEASHWANRLVRGAFWSVTGAVLSRAVGLVSSIVVARILGKVGLGELGIVQSTVGMFSTLAGLGLGLAATKRVSEHRVRDHVMMGETIGLLSLVSWASGVCMTIVILFLSPWLAQHTLAAPQLQRELEMGTLLLLFGVINGVQTGVLSGFEAFKTIAGINVITGLANFPIMICCTYFGGLAGAVWGLVAGLALNCFLNFIAVRTETSRAGITITYTHWHKHVSLLWAFGLPGMLSGFISGPVNWATSTILVNQPRGYAEMGLLNATNSWFQAVVLLPNLLGQVLLPILSSYTAARETSRVKRTLSVATWANVVIALPIVCLGCLFSRQIMALYGPAFGQGWPVLVATLLSAGVLMVQGPITNHLIASSRMWAYFLAHVGWAAVFVTGTYLLVPAYAGLGIAVARLIAYTTNGIVVAALFWYEMRGRRRGPDTEL
jgi:O-antigen/teichoic acid export membrane protein